MIRRALIVEPGNTRGALTAARALGAADWAVGVATPTGGGLAAASKWAWRRHRTVPPEEDLDAFTESVADAVRAGGYDVVFPGSDAEVLALSQRRAEIPATIPYAPHDRVVRALDKLALSRAASSNGIRAPAAAEATPENLRRWRYPAVMKARLHVPLTRRGGPARWEAGVVANAVEAGRRAGEIRATGGEPLLQEMLTGRLAAVTVVTDRDGGILAGSVQVADRTWPPVMGISARAHTVPADGGLRERVAGLLRDLGWFGLAQLQLVAPDSEEPWLIDLNGRFYGSFALAVAAGPNLAALWASAAIGARPPATESPRAGVRYQWLEGDLRRAAQERRGGLARDVVGCMRYSVGAVHSVWRSDDPRPAIAYLRAAVRRAIRRARRVATG